MRSGFLCRKWKRSWAEHDRTALEQVAVVTQGSFFFFCPLTFILCEVSFSSNILWMSGALPCLLTITLFWGVNYPCIYPVLSSKGWNTSQCYFISGSYIQPLQGSQRLFPGHRRDSVLSRFCLPLLWLSLQLALPVLFPQGEARATPCQVGLALLTCSTYKLSWISEHLALFQGLCLRYREMSDWQLESVLLFTYLRPEIRLNRWRIGSKPSAVLPCESCLKFANKGLVLMQIRS